MSQSPEIITSKNEISVAAKSNEYLELRMMEANFPPFPWKEIRNSFVSKIRQIIK